MTRSSARWSGSTPRVRRSTSGTAASCSTCSAPSAAESGNRGAAATFWPQAPKAAALRRRPAPVAWREMAEPAAPPGLSPARARDAARNTVLLVVGITALAFNLRAAITSLPPLFPELSTSLHLPSGAIAGLAALPVLAFGVCSGVAAPLSRRYGEEWVLGGALGLLAAGLLLRGALPGSLLFPGTALAGAAIALLNVLLPSLIKRRRPHQAGLLIGLYLLSLSAGSILA